MVSVAVLHQDRPARVSLWLSLAKRLTLAKSFHQGQDSDMRKIALGSVLLSAFVMYPVVAGASTITFIASGSTTGGGVVSGAAVFTTTTRSLRFLMASASLWTATSEP
jgi:hypothetical protein